MTVRRVLVIRLGALGDFVQSFGPFAAIRAHHPQAHITLLTAAPFAPLAQACPWFDAVEIDARPPWWDLRGLLHLRQQLRGFDFVYDLQTSGRSSRYFPLAGRPPWSGIAPGCSHPQPNPAREVMHTRERQADQLRLAGIPSVPEVDLHFLTDRPAPELPHPYALLVTGAAPHRPRKRWPVERYAALATILATRGIMPVVIGAPADAPLAQVILAACPTAIDLTGRTRLVDLFPLAERAWLAVGNDTGPMHIAAASGCRCLVLFSADSDPTLTAPRTPDGGTADLLRVEDLTILPVDRVAAKLT